MIDRQRHWDAVYASRGSDEMSWFEARPTVSLDLLARLEPLPST